MIKPPGRIQSMQRPLERNYLVRPGALVYRNGRVDGFEIEEGGREADFAESGCKIWTYEWLPEIDIGILMAIPVE